MKQLQHFSHPEHPLVFNEDRIYGYNCRGCSEPILGPSYSCKECGWGRTFHHKSCAELPLGLLHHPLHPLHPLLLFDEFNYEVNKDFSNCQVCKENRSEYCYGCFRCNFKLHIRCGYLAPTMEAAEVHLDHPLTLLCKWITFTCDLCGKEDKGMPYVCNPCGFGIHRRCAYRPRRLKVVRHNHPLNLIHSLELHQSNSQLCQLCFLKLDTNYGLYYCSRCDFAAHLDCAIARGNMEDINLLEFKEEESAESKATLENVDSKLDQSVDSEICKVIKTVVGEDGTEIATEIKHFSHEHELKLTDDEVPNNKICDGCVRAILTPSFYSCVDCSFFLHISCTKLPKIKQYPLHQHPLALTYRREYFWCDSCDQWCNGFRYICQGCYFKLDAQCSLISNTLTHACHEHPLYLSITNNRQKCSICGSEQHQVFRCTTCEFVLDFKCATLPQTAWYNQHEHPFTLRYTLEDDSDEYYCDICEEERDSKQWFYYCEDCSYPAHSNCIIGEEPNYKEHI